MAVDSHVSAPPHERILLLLGLEKSSSGEELRVMVGGRFRPPQQIQLADILSAMQSTSSLSNVTSWFSHQFDPTDDVEHYLQDLIRMHHYIASHDRQRPLRSTHLSSLESPGRESSAGANVMRQLVHFYASFADSRDRNLLTKIYQTLGLSRAVTYCVVAKTLSFKFQKEFLDLFVEDLPELRDWINWLDELEHAVVATSRGDEDEVDGEMLYGPGYESAVHFVSRTIKEHCMLTWLGLLRPLDTRKRLALIDAIHKLLVASNNSGLLSTTSSTLKKLGRFYETTGISAVKLLDLDVALRRELSLLLEEFPTIILITLFAKFNNEKMIQLVVKRGLPFFPKNDLLKMLDALAPAESNAIEAFVTTLFNFGRKKVDFLLMFLTFSAPSQLRLLDLMVATSNSPLNMGSTEEEEEDQDDPFANPSHLRGNYFLLKLFLFARLISADVVIQKLSTLPSEMAPQLMYGVVVHSAEDLIVLGRGLELVEPQCLQPFLRLFLAIRLDWREVLVSLVEEMPGAETLPLYETLLSLHASTCSTFGDDKVTTVLQMLNGLDKKDKALLCRDILANNLDSQNEGDSSTSISSTEVHVKVLSFLCECELARHKVLRLLRVIPFAEYDRLLFFLRTQRMPEQVALTRLMLSMPSDANCRLLAKMSGWPTEALDAFFQLLLMLAKVEYKMFAKLMGSQYVNAEQLEVFVTVAVDMLNQASSRELVIFAAELPVHIRNLFFEMLMDRPEKGVLLRIISYSTRVPPELMHQLVALFYRMSWEIRSSFVEQLRALDGANDVQNLAEVASNLEDNEALRLLVLLFNPLQIHIRVSLVALLLQLSIHERALVLSRLVKMPKRSVGSFCAEMCSPNCEPVSPSFSRVIGLVDPEFHTSLLRLLKSEPLWFFLRMMAEYGMTEENSSEEISELLNRLAKILTMFILDEHFLVLRDVIRAALGDALTLSNVVGVLSLFSGMTRLLDFLRYVNGFTKYARSSLLFRVLGKYQQPAFIFEMCRILDLDDAVFALKRLDRMWQRRHVELENAMAPLARLFSEGNALVKDDFCDLIVGFKGLSAALDQEKGSEERIVTPRIMDVIADNESSSDMDDEDGPDSPLRLPSATPPSHQPVQLNRHLQRTRPGQAFPRKRTDRNSWWQDLDDTSFLLLSHERQGEMSPQQHQSEQQEADSPKRSPKPLPSVFVLTEQPHSSRHSEPAHDCKDTNIASEETLPEIETASPQQQQQTPDVRTSSDWRAPRVKVEAHPNVTTLSRSESAPATLTFENDSPLSKQKRSRGMVAALDSPLEFHVGRNKGADFLQKQRQRVFEEKGASRIRHARTPAAQDHVMEARVSRALGRRSLVLKTTLSPLSRPDPLTAEHAAVALAKAAQLREYTPQGFITEPPVREQTLARHHVRILPTSPTTATPSSSKANKELSCEPVAPW